MGPEIIEFGKPSDVKGIYTYLTFANFTEAHDHANTLRASCK